MFNVELSIDSFGGHAVVALYGELDLADAPDLTSYLITAVAACGPSVIVDLAGLASIGSCGLGVLVRVLRWTRESGGDLALAAPQQQVRQVLSVTGLIDDFSVYPSVEQAAIGTRPHLSGSNVIAAPRRLPCHSCNAARRPADEGTQAGLVAPLSTRLISTALPHCSWRSRKPQTSRP